MDGPSNTHTDRPPPMLPGEKERILCRMIANRKRKQARWSDLPPEILRLIAHHLPTIWDYILFRAVCSSWRSAADCPPQTPSLLLPYDPQSTTRSFLDPYTFRITTMDIPEARGKHIYGTPHGWLVMLELLEICDDVKLFEVSLLNPITRAQISLPGLSVEIADNSSEDPKLVCPPILSANPALLPSQKVSLALLIFDRLAICRFGGRTGEWEWGWFDLSVPSNPHRILIDCNYFEGEFYVVDNYKSLIALSAFGAKMKRYLVSVVEDSIVEPSHLHLLESSGELWLLESRWTPDDFELFRSIRHLGWERIGERIGDRGLPRRRKRSCISLPSSGRVLVCFAGYQARNSCSDKKAANTLVANVCIFDIVAGNTIMSRTNSWQCSTRARRSVDSSSFGFSWIIPSLC